MKQVDNIIIENARIMYRNFSGAEQQFNPPGNRNFCVIIEDAEVAEALSNDGWNVKIRPPREEGDASLNYLPVAIKFGAYPPNVTLVTKRNKTPLTEETISTLDFCEISNVDLIIRPYSGWNDEGRIKAYVKTMYVTIEEDEFAAKYAD